MKQSNLISALADITFTLTLNTPVLGALKVPLEVRDELKSSGAPYSPPSRDLKWGHQGHQHKRTGSFPRPDGGPCRTRTCDQPVMSRLF